MASPTMEAASEPQSPIPTRAVFLPSAEVLQAARTGQVDLRLPLGDYAFDLEPNALAEGAVIGKDGVAVGSVGTTVTFRGTANGHPARLAATEAGVFAVVLGENPVLVQPAWVSDPGAPLGIHHVILASEARRTGPVDPESPADPFLPPVPARGAPAPANRVVRFLVEEDSVLYFRSSLGGTCQPCWVQVQQAVMNIAEAFFEDQLGIRFQITSQWACTTAAACPYTGFNIQNWLSVFTTRWESRTDEPAHELGHLLSGTNLNQFDGFAYLGVVNSPFGYAVSELAAASGLAFSPIEYWIAAHEIGHNFNGVHEEADVLGPGVTTIMQPTSLVKARFSDGSLDPAHNNAARIVAHAIARLPP